MIQNKNYLSIYAKSFNWAGFFLPKQTIEKKDLNEKLKVTKKPIKKNKTKKKVKKGKK